MQTDIDTVKRKIADYLKLSPDVLQDNSELATIVPDSFLLVELLIELQEDYDIRLVQADLQNVKSLSDLALLIAARAQGHTASESSSLDRTQIS